ncbi:MAG: polysaccharide biosynthesis protein, partial [Fibrobacterales bacterium]|nr:polysaccharide biosynthesis protein [Fibrobacterales bacterium]
MSAADREFLKSRLTAPQYEAVCSDARASLILAGAGSGKTRVLVYKIARLLVEAPPGPDGVPLDERGIMAVTFTNKAAGEMRDRIREYVGRNVSMPWMGTFHSICAKLLRIHLPAENGPAFRSREFSICNDDDQAKIANALMKEASMEAAGGGRRRLLAAVSSWKSSFTSPARALQEAVHGMLLVAAVLACFSYGRLYSRKVPTLGPRDVRRILAATVGAYIVFFAVANFVPDAYWTPFFLFLVALFLGRALLGILSAYGALRWNGLVFAAPVLAGLVLVAAWQLAGAPWQIAIDESLPVSRTISLSAFLLSAALFLALRGALSLAWGLWHRERRGLRKVYLFGEFDEAAKFLRSDSAQSLEILGLFVESPAQWGVQLNGVRILGGEEALKRACSERRPDAVVLAHRRGALSLSLAEFLRGRGLRCLEVDPWGMLLGSSVPGPDEIAMEQLMERREYRFVPSDAENYLRGKVVLVTGAGGSIGSELCRQVLLCRPKKLVLLGHGENSIVRIYRRFPAETREILVPAICPVENREALERVFAEHRPQIVFHAAAHKHVDLMELNPAE